VVPHPQTPYFPGEQWRTLDASFDTDRANRILDGLGLVDTDDDGYRNRLDGKGNLELFMASYGTFNNPIVENLVPMWDQVGIKLAWKEDRRSRSKMESGDYYFTVYTSYAANPWGSPQQSLFPVTGSFQNASQIGRYYETSGQEGMAPTGPDPAYLPAAPQGTYPADSTGKLKRLQEIYDEGRVFPNFDPGRIELGKETFRIHAADKYQVATVGFSGISRGVMMKRNNFRNVPKYHFQDKYGRWMDYYYFEDGIDNLDHPGNRSKRHASESFLTGYK
jgi:hypothetical protein